MTVYSFSRLETFETCALQYKFRYLDKIPREEEAVELFVGSRVHEALEKLYRDLLRERLDTPEELLAFYRAEWEKQWGPHVVIRDASMTQCNYFDYGELCIRNYYEQYHPFRQSRTLGTEVQLRFALDPGGRYQMQGYVDRVAQRADGTYEIHDYKTGRSLPAQDDVDRDRQLGLYHLGLKARWRDVERAELFWHYVGFEKSLRSERTPEQLGTLREETIQAIDGVERERAFDPAKGAWCDWCDYRDICPLWKHVESVAGLAPEQFAADAGVKLANAFAAAKLEMERLQERLDSLRGDLIAFAKQRKLRIVQGNGVRVSVKLQEKITFPRAGDPLRAKLEDLIRKSGRWEETSSLNTSALAKALEEEKWPPPLLERLRQFASNEEVATVTLQRAGRRLEGA